MEERTQRKLSTAELEKRLERGEKRRLQTREKLVAAAFELFAQRGRDTPSIDDVTAHAKVARSSFYNHFESRDALFEAVANGIGAAVQPAILAKATGVADPAERICRSFRIFLRWLVEDPNRGWALLRTFPITDEIDNESESFFEEALSEGIASGRFRALDRTVYIDAVVGLSIAAIRRMLTEDRGTDYIDNVAFGVMRFLGLPDEEARSIAFVPLQS